MQSLNNRAWVWDSPLKLECTKYASFSSLKNGINIYGHSHPNKATKDIAPKWGLASSDQWTKSGPLPVFVKRSYWNTATLFHLQIVHGCSYTTTAEFSSFEGVRTTHKDGRIYQLALHRKHLPRPLQALLVVKFTNHSWWWVLSKGLSGGLGRSKETPKVRLPRHQGRRGKSGKEAVYSRDWMIISTFFCS